MSRTEKPAERRRRGRPARISREQIVAAAQSFEPENLTMLAVARELGVERTALHYHVGGREDLLELVAAERFGSAIDAVELPARADWRDIFRAYAIGMMNAFVQTGSFAAYFTITSGAGLSQMRQAETLLQSLVDAGLDDQEASQAVGVVTGFVFSLARDVVMAGDEEVHPQVAEVQRVLSEVAPDDFPVLRRVLRGGGVGDYDRGLEFAVNLMIAGVERLLADRQR